MDPIPSSVMLIRVAVTGRPTFLVASRLIRMQRERDELLSFLGSSQVGEGGCAGGGGGIIWPKY